MKCFWENNTLIAGVNYAKYLPPFNGIFKTIKRHMETFKSHLVNYINTSPEDGFNYVQKFLEEQKNLENKVD